MGNNSEMDFEKVKSGLEDKSIILLDVRQTREEGAIPGAKHIWSELFQEFKDIFSVGDFQKSFLLICSSYE